MSTEKSFRQIRENATYKVAEIFTTVDGEQNEHGIGCPTIFVRMSKCHLRCYKDNPALKTLCDTPEFLDGKNGRDMSLRDILGEVDSLSSVSGIKKLTFSGGEFLLRLGLRELMESFADKGYSMTMETSGTLDWTKYNDIQGLSFVVDWKVKSAAIPKGMNKVPDLLGYMRKEDYIKFVIYDRDDFLEFLEAYRDIVNKNSLVQIAVGLYWGTPHLSDLDLFDWCAEEGLLGRVKMNYQIHKFIGAK